MQTHQVNTNSIKGLTHMNQFDFILVHDYLLRAEEVDAIARYMARMGMTANVGDPLPNLISTPAEQWIQNNLYSFRRKIENYRKYPNVPQFIKVKD